MGREGVIVGRVEGVECRREVIGHKGVECLAFGSLFGVVGAFPRTVAPCATVGVKFVC